MTENCRKPDCTRKRHRATGHGLCRMHYERDRTGSHRYPLANLLRHYPGTTHEDVAMRLGVEPRQVERWAEHGMRLSAADRAACLFGTHPGLVWPDLYWPASYFDSEEQSHAA